LQLLLAGLFCPITSACMGILNLVGRQIYGSGYSSKGADGRLLGYMLYTISQLGLAGIGMHGGLKMTGIFGK
jgi:hypothetical protein